MQVYRKGVFQFICTPIESLRRLRFIRKARILFRTFYKIKHDARETYEFIDVARKMCQVPLSLPSDAHLGMVSRQYQDVLELVVRQNIVKSKLHSSILPGLMHFFMGFEKGGFAPYPREWRNWLRAQGLPIASLQSFLSFQGYVIKSYFSGVTRAIFLVFYNARLPKAPHLGYAVLVNVPLFSTPDASVEFSECETYSRWYKINKLRHAEEKKIWIHDIETAPRTVDAEVDVVENFFPRMESRVARLTFALRTFQILGVALVRIVTGSWWAGILARDAVELAYFQGLDQKDLATTYVFNNSSWVHRPLWTYFAQDSEVRILLLYYSTNIEPFKYKDGFETPVFPSFEIMNWPQYCAWDQQQATFLKRVAMGSPVIDVVGPVFLNDVGLKLENLPANSIAVFDVRTYRQKILMMKGIHPHYYETEIVVNFLRGAYEAITSAGKVMVLKMKRDISQNTNATYIREIEYLKSKENVIIIDANISPFKIIRQVQALISIPYTSTAIIGQVEGKPSAYFDPTNTLLSDRELSHGVVVLGDKQGLKNWIDKVV